MVIPRAFSSGALSNVHVRLITLKLFLGHGQASFNYIVRPAGRWSFLRAGHRRVPLKRATYTRPAQVSSTYNCADDRQFEMA